MSVNNIIWWCVCLRQHYIRNLTLYARAWEKFAGFAKRVCVLAAETIFISLSKQMNTVPPLGVRFDVLYD